MKRTRAQTSPVRSSPPLVVVAEPEHQPALPRVEQAFRLMELPPELRGVIFKYLDPASLARMGACCKIMLESTNDVVTMPPILLRRAPIRLPRLDSDGVDLEKVRSAYLEKSSDETGKVQNRISPEFLTVGVPRAARRFQTICVTGELAVTCLSCLLATEGWQTLQVVELTSLSLKNFLNELSKASAPSANSAVKRSLELSLGCEERFEEMTFEWEHLMLPIVSLELFYYSQLLALKGNLATVTRLSIGDDFFVDGGLADDLKRKLPNLNELAIHEANNQIRALLDMLPGIRTLVVDDVNDLQPLQPLQDLIRSGVRCVRVSDFYLTAEVLQQLGSGPVCALLNSLILDHDHAYKNIDVPSLKTVLSQMKTLTFLELPQAITQQPEGAALVEELRNNSQLQLLLS